MGKYKHYYVSVSCDVQEEGLNMACWMSPQDLWHEENIQYPNDYDRVDGDFIWHVHANCELTIKTVSMITEYAHKIIEEQERINNRRKVANR